VFCPDAEKRGAWLGPHGPIQKDKRLGPAFSFPGYLFRTLQELARDGNLLPISCFPGVPR